MAPSDRGPWEALFVQLERELEAETEPPRRAALASRLALLHWDLLRDVGGAERCLALADGAHAETLTLRSQLLLARGDPAGAAELFEELAGHAAEPAGACSLLLEAALLRLLWLGDAAGAARTLARAPEDSAERFRLGELTELALLAADDLPALLARGPRSSAGLALAAAALWDGSRDAVAAAALARQAQLLDEQDPFVLELLLELGVPEAERAALLERKLALLASHDVRAPEARALSLELARSLTALGQTREAAALLEQFDPTAEELEATNPQFAGPLAWGETLLLLLRRDVAARLRDDHALQRAYEGLVHASRVPAVARAYRLRAAQLRQLLGAADEEVEGLLRANVEESPAEPHSARALEVFRLRRGRRGELCAHYEEQASVRPEARGVLLRQAAVIAEAQLKDPSLAASLRRDGLAALPDPLGASHLQRLYRALAADARLLDAYRREADESADPALASLLYSAGAALALKLQQPAEAEVAAEEALQRQPEDLLALAVLAWVHRLAERNTALAAVLQRQTEVLRAPVTRAACHRQLAALARSRPDEAREHLTRALRAQPGDASVLADLFVLCERADQPAEAARVGLQLAEALGAQPGRAAEVLLRVAQLQRRLGDRARANEAVARALELDPHSLEALREVARARREEGDLVSLLGCLHRLAPLEPEADGRATVLLDLARVMERLEHGADEVLDAYTNAARLDSAVRHEALTELERICRATGRLDVLAPVLAELPPAAPTLEALASVLRELGDQQGLCEVQAQLVELAASPLERADRRFELGRLFEAVGQGETALVQYQQVVAEMRGHQPALRALERLYRTAGGTSELVQVLAQELDVATSDPGRQVEILLELAQILEPLGRVAEAAQRLEAVLVAQPENLDALWSLERLYEVDHPRDLARVLRRRAACVDAAEHAGLCLRAAELLLGDGDDEGAAEALHEAVFSDPSNRDAFTSYERFLFDRALYHELFDLYARVIRFVEEEGGRAYRPVDLYSRRGQLQLKHLGQPGEAAASYLKALEHDPKSESTMKALEAIFLQQEDWLGLVRAFEHRANLVPHNELFRLESLHQAARLASSRLPHLPAEGQRLWEAIRALDPIDEEAMEYLQQTYEAAGNNEQLVDLLENRVVLLTQDEQRVAMHLRIATLCEQQLEDPQRAAQAYEGVRVLEEHHEQALHALARIYEGTNRWEKCLGALKDLVIIEANPEERSLLYFKCGSVMESRFNDDVEAARYYEAALGEERGCLPAVHGLRDLYLRREDWNKALETLEAELLLWEEKREQAGILARMGEIRLLHLRDARKAVEHFEAALAVDPECQPAALALFDHFFERGDNARALELAESLAPRMAKEGDPKARSTFYCRRGQMLAAGGRLHAAVESLVVALELRPKNLEALDWLIALCRRSPDAYDFATIFRELEQVYRREGDQAAVGHVLVAAGALSEIAGDAEGALDRYREAVEAAPQDLTPVRSLADLFARLRRFDDAVAALRALAARAIDPALKLRALLRLGDQLSHVAGDSERTSEVYLEVLALDPGNSEAAHRLAQEHFLLGRFDEAQRLMRALIERTLSEGTVRSKELSQYTHYLGAILVQLGDTAGAMDQLRRALQLDERNAAAVMALARQLTLAGDRAQAVRLLERTLQLVGEASGATAIDLRRSLAALLLGGGDGAAGVAQLEAVARDGGRIEDRIALAEVCATRPLGLGRAVAELEQVVAADTLNLHALRLLADLYPSAGQSERAAAALQVVAMMGGADDAAQRQLEALRRQFVFKPVGVLDSGLRQTLLPPARDPFVSEVWAAVREPLERLFAQDAGGGRRLPGEQLHAQFRQIVEYCTRLLGAPAQVDAADGVPGGVVVLGEGRIVLDALLLQRTATELAFVLGRSLEYLRSGHALTSRLAFDDRLLLAELLGGLLQPPEASGDLVQEFRRNLVRRAAKEIDDVAVAHAAHVADGGAPDQPARWLSAVDRAANAHGLLASDDISAALRMLAQLSGQELALGPQGEVLARLVTDGPELVRLFLSPEFLELKRELS